MSSRAMLRIHIGFYIQGFEYGLGQLLCTRMAYMAWWSPTDTVCHIFICTCIYK